MLAQPFQEGKYRLNSNFWKLWIGQTISTFGSSFTGFALPLLVFRLTGSSLNLSLIVTATVLPYLLFGLVMGAWADRTNRRVLMILADIIRALIIVSIPLASLFGFLSIWWIYAVAFLTSTLTICFDAANFAALPSLVRQEEIVTANGRLQAGYSVAKVSGPLLGGLLILVLPLPMLLLIDAISYFISAGSLLLIHTSFTTPINESRVSTSLRREIGEGLHYVFTQPILFWLSVLLLLVNFILPTASTQLVLLAKQWFAASDTQVGLLYAAGSFGTVLFSFAAGYLHKRCSFGVLMMGSLMLEGFFIVASVVTHVYGILLLCWTIRGGVDILFVIASYSLAQMVVPGQLLGRVITFIRVLTWSTASLGALCGGIAIERTHNVGMVYIVVGLLIFGINLAFFLTPLGHAERYLPEKEAQAI